MPVMRLGIAGLGFGRAVHLPVFAALPDVKVVAVLSTRRDRAEDAAREFGVGGVHSDSATFLAEEMDAVSLALPPGLSVSVANRALERGLAVLSEKPLAADAEQATALARLAEGRTTAINFSFAELDAFRAVKALIGDGSVGKVLSAHVSWLSHSYAHRNALWSWKLDGARGGGVMASQGSHVLYLAEWLFGPVEMRHVVFDGRATASIAPAGALPAEDGAALVMTLPGGGTMTAALSNASPGGDLHRWEIVCEGGTVVLARNAPGVMTGFTAQLFGADGVMRTIGADPVTPGDDGRTGAFRRLAERFTTAVRTGTPCAPDFAEGARVQTLMEQASGMAERD